MLQCNIIQLTKPQIVARTVRIAPVSMPVSVIGTQGYTTHDTYYNLSFYARALPPVPAGCPTAMGTLGPQTLPPADQVAKQVFARRKYAC